MKKLLTAISITMFSLSSFASVCPSGQTLLAVAGQFTSSTSCSSGIVPGTMGGLCYGTTVTTQPYACASSSGVVSSSGVMTVTNSSALVSCNAPACQSLSVPPTDRMEINTIRGNNDFSYQAPIKNN